MVVVNTLYDVGARDENENKTGFAHLFEHLMFGGSVNISDFDKELQKAGGESNAFTSNDVTNYYDIVPAQNIETALWLESDRMLSLAFTDKSLEVQRNVVIEEFKQRYLNQPYGDVWLELRPLAYEKHPYKWATIGKDIAHIENANMEDVKSFFKSIIVRQMPFYVSLETMTNRIKSHRKILWFYSRRYKAIEIESGRTQTKLF